MACSAVLMLSLLHGTETSVTVLVLTPRKNSLCESLEPHAVPSNLVFPLEFLAMDRQLGLVKKFSFQLEATLVLICLPGGMSLALQADEWHQWHAGLLPIGRMLHQRRNSKHLHIHLELLDFSQKKKFFPSPYL